ncbi:MAG TPA: DUF748 domain-containing protein, partial [Thermoanaerobaculia bacterium]|nr:DUF748 domain-containing protein [Thermoanaerobaculia bacterium]
MRGGEPPLGFLEGTWRSRLSVAGLVAGGLLLFYGLLGFLVLPSLLRPVVERSVADVLHRKVSLRGLSINPFTLSATLKGLEVKERDGTTPFLSFESLDLNAEASSVLRGGPVLRAITLVKPSLSLVRKEDGTYNVQDLMDEASKAGPKDDKPLRFSLNNIRLEGGRIDFDDRPKKTRHEIRDLQIGIPFLSNIPSKVEITTLPVLDAKVNGSPFALRGKTRPFSRTHETAIDLDLSDVDVPFYLAYVPVETRSKLTSARLDAKLAFSFTQPPKGRPALVVSGTLGLRKVVLSFASPPAFDVVLSEATVVLEGLSTEPGKPAALKISAKGDAGEVLESAGAFTVEPLALEGSFSVDGVSLKRYGTLLGELVPVAIDDGILALKTRYRWTTGTDANTVLSGLSVEVKSPRVRKKSETKPFFKAASLTVADTSLDLAKHALVLGSLESTAGVLAVAREEDGNADLAELVPKSDPDAPPAPPWDVTTKRIALHDYTVRMDDRAVGRPARYHLTKTDLVLEGLSTAKGSKGALSVRFGVDGRGVAFAKGTVGFKPMFADLRVDVKGVDLVPIRAYVLQDLRLDLAKGSVSAAGSLAIREDSGGKASVVYEGNAVVANLLAVDESTKLDVLKWETFSGAGMKAGYN